MRNIKPETLEKCLSVLKEMKYMADNKLKMDAKNIALKYHTSQAVPLSAKRVGFFTTNGYAGMWLCKKARFDPMDARTVLEDVYDNQKPKRQLANINTDLLHNDQILLGEVFSPLNDMGKNNNQIPPKLEDVERYCNERRNDVNPGKFMAYYEQKGWRIGKEKMKNWKMAIHTWEQRNYNLMTTKKLSDYSDQELVDELKRRGYTGIMEIKNTITF